VLTDSASIVAALDKIADATAQLNNPVIYWDGSLLRTLPIIADSTALLADINSATQTVEQSANYGISHVIYPSPQICPENLSLI